MTWSELSRRISVRPGAFCVLLTISLGAAAAAGEPAGPGALFRPWPEGLFSRGGLDLKWHTEEEVEDQDEDFGMIQFGVRDTVPIYDQGPDQVLFSVSHRTLWIDTDARLPRTPGEDFPDELHSLNLGVSYRRELGADRIGVITARVGSASDELFEDDTTVVSASAMVRLPEANGNNAWVFGVNYQNRRGSEDLDHLPLPSVAYHMSDGASNWAVLGFPYSGLHLEAEEWLKLDVSYMFMRTVRAKLAYPLQEKLDLYGAFAWESDSFYRADREDEDDRLVFYEKQLGMGISYNPSETVGLGVEAGWSFDRFVYEDEDYDDRKDNWLEIEDAVYFKVFLSVSF